MLAFRRKKLTVKPKFLESYRQRFFNDPLHICFGCSQTNPLGLKLDFYTTDQDGLGFKWHPKPGLESFPNIVHGGISGTLLDELGGVLIQAKLNKFAFTISSRIHYRSAIYSDRPVLGHAKILRKTGRSVLVEAVLYTEEGKILSSMVGLYYIPSKKVFQHVTKIDSFSPEIGSYIDSRR